MGNYKRWQGRTDGQGNRAVVATKLAGPEGDELGAKHDGLLGQQRDGTEGSAEVVVVYVRRDAVLLRASQRGCSASHAHSHDCIP